MVAFLLHSHSLFIFPPPIAAGANGEQKCTKRSEQICEKIFLYEEDKSVPTVLDLTLLLSSQRK